MTPDEIEQKLRAFNAFISEQDQLGKEIVTGSNLFKDQMQIAQRDLNTRRNPAAAALGGGTMSTAPLASATASLGNPSKPQTFKANPRGK